MAYSTIEAFSGITIFFPQLDECLRIKCMPRYDTRLSKFSDDAVSFRLQRLHQADSPVAALL